MFCAGKRTRLAFNIFTVNRGPCGIGPRRDFREAKNAIVGSDFPDVRGLP